MYKKVVATFLLLFLLIPGIIFTGQIPDFKLKNLKNRTVSFSEIKGEKLTVIDFWATWCKPCVRSIPKLVAVYEKYKNQGVQFIGINVDGTRNLPKVRPYVRALKITYPVLLDINDQLRNDLRIVSIPYILVVDQNNNIVFTHIGYRPGDEKVLEEEIKKLLKEAENKPQ